MDEIAERIKERIREMKEERKIFISELQAIASKVSDLEKRMERTNSLAASLEALKDDIEKKTSFLEKRDIEKIRKEAVDDVRSSIADLAQKEASNSYAELKSAMLGIVQGGLEKNREAIERSVDIRIDEVKKSIEEKASTLFRRSLEEELQEVSKVREKLKEQVYENLKSGLRETEEQMRRDIEREVRKATREEVDNARKDVDSGVTSVSSSIKLLEDRLSMIEREMRIKTGSLEEYKLEEFVKAKELEELRSTVREMSSKVSRDIESLRSEIRDDVRGQTAILKKEGEVMRIGLEAAIQDRIRSIGREVKTTVSSIYEESESMALNYLRTRLEAEVDKRLEEKLSSTTSLIIEQVVTRTKREADELLRASFRGKEIEFKTAMASEVNYMMDGLEERLKRDLKETILTFKEEVKKKVFDDINQEISRMIRRELREQGVVKVVGFDDDREG